VRRSKGSSRSDASPVTSVETIRIELARRIVSGVLAPGAPLDESDVAAEFAVSRTPVREAFRQLSSSGLIEQRAYRKSVVCQPDERDLAGMFAVMGHLEALCAGLSAINMTPMERRALEAVHDEMAGLVRNGATVDYATANEGFHNAIYAGTHNAYLVEITRATRLRVQPFRRAQFSNLGRLAASHAEHTAILAAVLKGDRAAAETAMRLHIGHVETAWLRFAGRAQTEAPPEI
jgi:DNA-binding GntR family transcriptional regulator